MIRSRTGGRSRVGGAISFVGWVVLFLVLWKTIDRFLPFHWVISGGGAALAASIFIRVFWRIVAPDPE